MGANARKINNARSQQVFNEASNAYGATTTPTDNEKNVAGIAANPYTQQETQDIRSRSLRPIQSAYSSSGEDMKRAALTSGGAPNLIASLAKNNRNRIQAMSDANTDVNAGIASDTLNKKIQASTLLGQLQGQRQNYGLGLMGTQNSVKPQEGFGWGKLAGLVGQGIGAASSAFGTKKPSGGYTVANNPSGGG